MRQFRTLSIDGNLDESRFELSAGAHFKSSGLERLTAGLYSLLPHGPGRPVVVDRPPIPRLLHSPAHAVVSDRLPACDLPGRVSEVWKKTFRSTDTSSSEISTQLSPLDPRARHGLKITAIFFGNRIFASDGRQSPEPMIGLFLQLAKNKRYSGLSLADDALVRWVHCQLDDRATCLWPRPLPLLSQGRELPICHRRLSRASRVKHRVG